jgi:hypothetical protein
MPELPSALAAIVLQFSSAFSRPTFARFVALFVGVVVSSGRSTVHRSLSSIRELLDGHWTDYHRLFSQARWSCLQLGRVLASQVLALIPEDQPVILAVDDTVTQHRGKYVFGKGCHRDAVRSSHAHTVWRWGHKWVVLRASLETRSRLLSGGGLRAAAAPSLRHIAVDMPQSGFLHRSPGAPKSAPLGDSKQALRSASVWLNTSVFATGTIQPLRSPLSGPVDPFVLRLARRCRTRSASGPHPGVGALLAKAGFILEAHRNPLAGMPCLHGLQFCREFF